MKFDVKLFVGGKVCEETVQAVNRDNAIDTAKARNPHARVIGVNPNLRCSSRHEISLLTDLIATRHA